MVIIFTGLFALVLFWLQQQLYRRWWKQDVTVLLGFEKSMVRAGEEVRLLEVVENRKRLPLPSLKVKFQCSRYLLFEESTNSSVTDRYYRNDLFSVMPYQRVTRTHCISCPRRGYYGIYGIDLVGADLFFSEELTHSMGSETILYVLPAALAHSILATAIKRIQGELEVRKYVLEDPFTYQGIREYQPFDAMKDINWKASARTDELKVNIRSHTAVSSVRIFMNLEDNGILRREELLEMSLSLCVGLAEHLLSQGIRLSIYGNGTDCVSGQILELPDLTDKSSVETVYKALARIDLNRPVKEFEEAFADKLVEQRENIYTLFISPELHRDYQQVLLNYQVQVGENFLWICPVKKEKEAEKEIFRELRKQTLLLEEQE